MDTLSVRFEQKRGHLMILEREPSLSREDLNETQLRMMKRCDIPGLLPLETEEVDGRISLRYTLTGTRMLSEAMRTASWSMAEMMGALCRLGEVLEECRMYLLDADRIKLQDEYIFVGDAWNELKFTYLPIDMPTLRRADDLERLIIRWMMKVKEPDGQTMQAVLRLVASPGFIPISLSRYARQYLSGTYPVREALLTESPVVSGERYPIHNSVMMRSQPTDEPKPQEIKKSGSWNLWQPESGDLQPLSEMLGEPNESSWKFAEPQNAGIPAQEESGDSDSRRSRSRIVTLCAAVFVAAIGWRFLYLDHPGSLTLLMCIGVTLCCSAVVMFMWNGRPTGHKIAGPLTLPRNDKAEESLASPARSAWNDYNNENSISGARFPSIHRALTESGSPQDQGMVAPAETTWMSGPADRTALLNREENSGPEASYIICSTRNPNSRIPLSGQSIVIGRSAEAAQHVDESTGISRAHVELVRVADRWKVKDLGSRNGTKLNDKPMAPYELYLLKTGDIFNLAGSEYRFQRAETATSER